MNAKKLKEANEIYELIEILQREINLIDKDIHPIFSVVPKYDISKKLKVISELINSKIKERLTKELEKLKKEFKQL
jgi:hypothetical protein